MKRKHNSFPFFSKFFLLFIVFLIFLFFSNNTFVEMRLFPRKNYYQNPSSPASKQATEDLRNKSPFNWSVEKVDENITKIAIPPDPRMSTAEELNEAMSSYRKSHNLPTLSQSDLLCSIAQNRANEQLANGGLDNHAGFEKYAQNQNEFSRMGEVLFGGAQPQYGVHIVEYGWDRSLTGHREAIQNPAWNYGCGGVAGYYAVFIFGTP
ncbi:MAG: hypothetical protein HYW63_00175 [Candidatus Levybacteria bacterium]|nr:hypothetical protein [Candidatus Levybacteria bacterium]